MFEILEIIIILILFYILIRLFLNDSYDKQKTGNFQRTNRINRYKRSKNEHLFNKIAQILIEGSDLEFNQLIEDIKKRANLRYSVRKDRIYHTRFKRAIYDVVNSKTTEIPRERLNKINEVFPLIRRAYFGPGVNKKIYQHLPRKFVLSPKRGEELPRVSTIVDLALHLNISVNVLMGYCYTQKPVNTKYYLKKDKKTIKNLEHNSRHYKRHTIIKPSGSKRLISAPRFYLKQIQKQILTDFLEKIELTKNCTGFIKEKSIKDNASPHLRCGTLVKLDLHNFFPSLKLEQVLQVFQGMGYNKVISGALACLCTDFINSSRFLPQGAPTSPMIANLYTTSLDKRLEGLWSKYGFTYTRYADDLTFSHPDPNIRVKSLIEITKKIVRDEKLYISFDKIRVYRKGQKKKITGVVVNEKMNVDRNWKRQLRAEIHAYNNDRIPSELQSIPYAEMIKGKIAFLNMIDPIQAERYQNMVKQSLRL